MTTEIFPMPGEYREGSLGFYKKRLSDAEELLREIRDGLVNSQDEADKFLRDHKPSDLARVTAERDALKNPSDEAISASFYGLIEDQSMTGQIKRREEFKRRYLLVVAAIVEERL